MHLLQPLKQQKLLHQRQMQLAVLLQGGAKLPDVAAACERQPQACYGGEEWAKVLSLKVGLAAGAKTWWGCTPLTWDQHIRLNQEAVK